MEKSIGEKLKDCRRQSHWTQEELAEQLNVTRQAVSNWERDKTLPDVYMLKRIAEIFDMTLDEYMENTTKAEVKMPKMPGIFACASVAAILLYLVLGGTAGRLMVEVLVEMVIICVFCQCFVHLYLSYAVKSGNFSMLAGYDSKVEYNVEEVKKVFVQMDCHVAVSSFGSVLLLGMCAFIEAKQAEIVSICVVLSYCLDFTLALCFYNYRSLDKIMVREIDRKIAKASYLSVGWFVGYIFVFIGAIFVKFELRSIRNNSPQAVGHLGWIFLFLVIITAELFYEQYQVKKKIKTGNEYKPGTAFWISTMLAAAVIFCMLFCNYSEPPENSNSERSNLFEKGSIAISREVIIPSATDRSLVRGE